MSKQTKLKASIKDKETKQEIDRQHALLLANLDRKQLLGNVTMEDQRHHRQEATLTQKQRRGRYQITTQKNELLNDLRKVRSGYTGHYDETKSPLENIQKALRTKSQTPSKSSRLKPPINNFAMRRCVSSEVLRSTSPLQGGGGRRRAATSLGRRDGDAFTRRPRSTISTTRSNTDLTRLPKV